MVLMASPAAFQGDSAGGADPSEAAIAALVAQTSQSSQAQILQAFQQILAAHESNSNVATKAEEAEQQKNQAALATASNYSTDSIVRGLADLQLQFGSAVTDLSSQLSGENNKLEDLQRAIAFQSDRLTTLRKTRIVADAMHIYRQEHQARLQRLASEYEADRESLDQEMANLRRQWERDEEAWAAEQEESAARRAEVRSLQAADYVYDNELEQRLALDDYDSTRRQQQRELAQAREARERDWAEREETLREQQSVLADYQAQVEAEPEALESAIQEAREEGIRDVNRQARTKAELADKEWEGTQQGYELQLTAIEQKIERQAAQMEALSEQLQAAMAQAQSLALRAFETSSTQLAQA